MLCIAELICYTFTYKGRKMNNKVKFTWFNGKVPKELKIKQVYGVPFSSDGRILIMYVEREDEKFYSLAGGRPEPFDKNLEATLRRELIEEINTTIKKNPILIGYQKVEMEDVAPFAQIRMVTMIDKIGENRPDPDNGLIYKRFLVSPKRAIELLNWKGVGEPLINEATRLAKLHFGLKKFLDKDEEV